MEDFFVSSYGMPTFIALVIWSTIWKGLALWRAAKRNSRIWYVILLVFNTLGILEIIYLYLISPVKSDQKSE
jgi:uncharacterized protein (DUF983 family)